jgi:flagellar protein FlbT
MSTLKISLKANEKIYVNGAVIKTDRKVTLEFLNNVQFLLENHVLQAEDARQLFAQLLPRLLNSFTSERIRAGLKHVEELVSNGQVYDALKEIRALYPVEDEIMTQSTQSTTSEPVTALAGE